MLWHVRTYLIVLLVQRIQSNIKDAKLQKIVCILHMSSSTYACQTQIASQLQSLNSYSDYVHSLADSDTLTALTSGRRTFADIASR
jgi:hypothetical protein